MKRRSALGLVTLLAASVGIASCASDYDLFSEGGTGAPTGTTTGGTGGTTATGAGTTTGGTGGTTTTGAGTTTGGTGGTTTTGAGTTTGGTGGTAGTGGTGGTGGTSTCAHDECTYGPPLVVSCSQCATLVCGADPFCCNNAGGSWDYHCIDAADQGCSGVNCGAGKPSCDSLYSLVLDYHACAESAAMCAFGFNNRLLTCAQACTAHGGECVYAYDNQNGTWCAYEAATGCNYQLPPTGQEQYNVCVCSRGCGSGPPCTTPQRCIDGVCQ